MIFFVFFLLILYLSRIVHIQFGKPRVQFREILVGNFAETLANLVERSIKMLVAVSLKNIPASTMLKHGLTDRYREEEEMERDLNSTVYEHMFIV